MLILFHTNSNPFKNLFWNNSGYRIGKDDFLICVLTDISSVRENTCERVFVEAVALGRADASCVQIFDDIGDGLATCISAEHFKNKRCLRRIDLVMLLVIDHIAKRNRATVETALEGVLGHASRHLLSQISGIVFRHTFSNNC